ncbi:universal stress protein [Saccharopolyspora rosea]|uniref:Universal stress protein n=1 Tax=Saccharopolyspora rosea TaxID=524884 RepID=A0ABW3FY80_9PSEU
MVESGRREVLVGVDLSESSRRAVRWAALEAAGRRRPLRLVHVLTWPEDEDVQKRLPERNEVVQPLREELRSELDMATEVVRDLAPDVEVRSDLPLGDPAEVLADLAERAELLVLGGPRTADGFGVVGATSAEVLARRAGGPVVVVRGSGDQWSGGPVVVGVDGSRTSERAIGFGYDFASRHDLELVAVHAWSDLPLDPFRRVRSWELPWSEVRGAAEEVLAESVAGWKEHYPDVSVRRAVTPEKPVHALLREAEQASLVVVGSHGRGRVKRAVLGSVSHAVVNRAPRPVAVLPAG